MKDILPPFKISLHVNNGNLGIGFEVKEWAGGGAKLLVVHRIIVKMEWMEWMEWMVQMALGSGAMPSHS